MVTTGPLLLSLLLMSAKQWTHDRQGEERYWHENVLRAKLECMEFRANPFYGYIEESGWQGLPRWPG